MTGIRPNPEVDLIVVTYQAAADIQRLVAEAIDSTAVSLRAVVVDNASGDGTAELAANAGGTILQLDDNVGYGAAANRGISESACEWIVVANQDIELPSDAIARLIEANERWERRLGAPVVVGPALLRPNGEYQETCHSLPSLVRQLVALLVGERASGTRNVASRPEEQVCGWLSAVLVLARRTTFARVGGFDPNYFMYVEDVDLFSRLRAKGVRCVWVPEVKVIHHGGHASRSPHLHAQALLNWVRYFRDRNGRLAGSTVLGAAVIGSVARGVLWRARASRGVSGARDESLMFCRGALDAWRCRHTLSAPRRRDESAVDPM